MQKANLSRPKRPRDETRWGIPFQHHQSLDSFSEVPRNEGLHSINLAGEHLDLYVVDRGHAWTLVTFNGALSEKVETSPQFQSGVAKDVGINLISLSDPSMTIGDVHIAWYMGNRYTGSLKPALRSVVSHVLESMGNAASNAIFFGASGGGLAAANLAHEFPESTALIFNPRLSLARYSRTNVRKYLQQCHGVELPRGKLTPEAWAPLSSFGPLEAHDLVGQDGLSHDLLIHQNLLDPVFLRTQLMPFMSALEGDPRLRVRFSVDAPGHSRVPPGLVRDAVRALVEAPSKMEGMTAAGYLESDSAIRKAFSKIPELGAKLVDLHRELQASG